MDDMQLVADLVQDTRLPNADELASARERMIAAVHEERASDGRPIRLVRRRRRIWRPVVVMWISASVAAAVVTAALIGTAGTPQQTSNPVPAADAQAIQVLQNAAAAALKLPDIEPRPSQFIYQKTQLGTETRESWSSVDGTRDGFGQAANGGQKNLFPGCRDGRRAAIKDNRVIGTEPCTPQPAYLADLPAEADAMLTYLNKHYGGKSGDVNAMGKYVLELGSHYLRPQARAALLQAVAKIPGLRLVPEATDGAERTGVGVAWSFEGAMAPGSRPGDRDTELVFDAKTYALLGTRTGRDSSAVLAVAVVDEAGQRP